MTTTQTSEQLQAAVATLAKRLRMPYLRKAAVEVLPTANAQRWDPAEVLRVLLEEEPEVVTPRRSATAAGVRGSPTGLVS